MKAFLHWVYCWSGVVLSLEIEVSRLLVHDAETTLRVTTRARERARRNFTTTPSLPATAIQPFSPPYIVFACEHVVVVACVPSIAT